MVVLSYLLFLYGIMLTFYLSTFHVFTHFCRYKVVDINDEFELCKTCDYLLSYQNFEVKEKGQGQERVQVKEQVQVQVQDKDNGATKTQTKELTKEQAKEKQRH